MLFRFAHPPVFWAVLSVSFLPFTALILFSDARENVSVIGLTGIAIIGLSWIMERWIGQRRIKEISIGPPAAAETQPLPQRGAPHGIGQAIAGSVAHLMSLTEEHQKRAEATTSLAAKAAESANGFAGAIEEMKASIEEIGRQTEQTSGIAGTAVGKTQEAGLSVAALGAQTKDIVKIIEMIRSVAERTNLLALNASIEAARAGEHGRGFAVVAQEVKTLANQTAEATKKIEVEIGNVVAASNEAQKRMTEVQDVIQEINAMMLNVKSALHQQTAASGEIAASTVNTTKSVDGVTAGISHLLITTEEIRRACLTIGEKTGNLKKA